MRQELLMLKHFSEKTSAIKIAESFVQVANIEKCARLNIETGLKEEIIVSASRFFTAVDVINSDTINLSVEKAALIAQSGNFRASIPAIDAEQTALFSGPYKEARIKFTANAFKGIAQMLSFVENERGVLFSAGYAWAKNSIAALKCPATDGEHVAFIVPAKFLQALLNTKREILSVARRGNTAVFFLDGKMWAETRILDDTFPDLNVIIKAAKTAIPDGLFDACKQIAPFCGTSNRLRISNNVRNDENTASVSGFDITESAFNGVELCKILEIADKMDFGGYPQPVQFAGEFVTGAIAPMMID